MTTELDLLKKSVAGHEFTHVDSITRDPFNCKHFSHRMDTTDHFERQICWKARVSMWLKTHEIKVVLVEVDNYLEIAEVTGMGRDRLARVMSEALETDRFAVIRYAPGYYHIKYVHRDFITDDEVWTDLRAPEYWRDEDNDG